MSTEIEAAKAQINASRDAKREVYQTYKTYTVGCQVGDLGTIALKEDAQPVDEVIVVGESFVYSPKIFGE